MSRRKNISVLNLTKKKDWTSSWYTNKNNYSVLLQEDILIYIYLRSKLVSFFFKSVFELKVIRVGKNVILSLFGKISKISARKVFFNFLYKLIFILKTNLFLIFNKISLEKILLNAKRLALKIAVLIEKQIKFRSKIIKLILKKLSKNCTGVYVECKGRINNVDMARNDKLLIGSTPLQTLNKTINYGLAIANTFKGLLSIKVWICK